jgi:hypothetical protein
MFAEYWLSAPEDLSAKLARVCVCMRACVCETFSCAIFFSSVITDVFM